MTDFLNDNEEQSKVVGEFEKHPSGTFEGTITEVKQKVLPSGTPIYTLYVKTIHGTEFYSIWGFSEQDKKELNDPSLLDKKSFERKRFFAKLTLDGSRSLLADTGVYDHTKAKSLSWDIAGNDNIVNSLNKLIGHRCSITVSPNPKNTQYNKVAIKGLMGGVTQIEQAPDVGSFEINQMSQNNTVPQNDIDTIPF